MTTPCAPEDWLPLAGIQHFVFCRRQWALITIERMWQENRLTAEGAVLHETADDPFFTEKRKGVIVARAVPVSSPTLGLTGICDVVEFTQVDEGDEGVRLPGRAGRWSVAPVEYKRGKPKQEVCDEAQLCAQALCLEEMLITQIPCGSLYYGQTRRRMVVELGEPLRALVRSAAREMHALVERGYTPRVKPFKGCAGCSLADLCLPANQASAVSASAWIAAQVEEG